MTWKERWNYILLAFGFGQDKWKANWEIIKKTVDEIRGDLQYEIRERLEAQRERDVARGGEGRSGIVQIVQHNDMVGDLTVLCRKPDGQLEELRFDTSKPRSCPVPEGFRVVQIGAISPAVPFENPSSPGTLVANAMRRFNDNVLRFPDFKGIVRDEGMQTDGNDLGTSTVLLEFGKRKYEIVVTCKDRLTVPDGAIADPKIVDPRTS